MKIAIEAQRIFRVNKHGMDFVALEVIRELQKIDRENEYFILVNAGEDRCLEESENMHIVTVNAPLYPLWEQVCLPEAVRRIGPDILHCTGNTAPLRCDVPLVLTLHDIIFLEKRSGSSPSWYQNMGCITGASSSRVFCRNAAGSSPCRTTSASGSGVRCRSAATGWLPFTTGTEVIFVRSNLRTR